MFKKIPRGNTFRSIKRKPLRGKLNHETNIHPKSARLWVKKFQIDTSAQIRTHLPRRGFLLIERTCNIMRTNTPWKYIPVY